MSQHFQLKKEVSIAVLTVSDTRTETTDKGGALVRKLAAEAGFTVKESAIVADDLSAIQEQVSRWLSREDVDAIITTGGTGIAKRDVTLEAVRPLYEKEIDGFGELFRYLSFTEDVGTRALLSRASAGVVGEKVIFALPGSTGAVKLAMNKLISLELEHIVYEITKHRME
ncbi:MogA/MoaB family molybdenum cofactor biosynthesis protein [Bacillus xiapuensis]|uniref:MogA/MoaB family molybdenum cofactor biosynthesis protein n=1 Tax=Bacillus xiapuensis TaxID=2014075 RepID=UPI000C2482AA|nr:MogA/MoaB family molybdenum cofactor biosynthesis protein [Bacillus xiapuensis]